VIPVVLLGCALACALAMIPLGLPGTWVMLAAAGAYALLLPRGGIGVATIAGIASLAVFAEFLDYMFAARFTRRYGGSRRAGWGAVIGGFAGVAVGVPVPIVGPVIGGLAGTFLGALIAEFEVSGHHGNAARVAYGALLGRVAASATKVALGAAMAAWIVVAVSV
jgi:uncharacterized protein